MNPVAEVEPHEQHGPQPRRRLTATGRMVVAAPFIILAALALVVLFTMPSRFGAVGW